MADTRLKYVNPLQSFLDGSFFQEFSKMKLEVLKLNSDYINIRANLELDGIPKGNTTCALVLNAQSFSLDGQRMSGVPVKGRLYNFNTVEDFKKLPKEEFINERGSEIWNSCKYNINECTHFGIISFADLKKYKFYYWVYVPSFLPKDLTIQIIEDHEIDNVTEVQKWFQVHYNEWVCIDTGNDGIVSYSREQSYTHGTLCIRDTSNTARIPSSIVKNILCAWKYHNQTKDELKVFFIRADESSFGHTLKISGEFNESRMRITGWERNVDHKLLPRMIDMSTLMDPNKIAEQSVDLNLKLMKWRAAPELDLDIIKGTKILILGSGTLGCYVSRALMAWGVRTITLVDNSTVSYSNPVRQPLFEFADYGKPKGEAAAAALKRVFPMINSMGIELSIPMIGHPITNETRERNEYDRLVSLIDEHDVIFLLMDSRETRWLPTVLGNLMDKVVINAALGFDSYLVMRHGNYSDKEDYRLGCYFCNDVVVPSDSLTDKTLDQMCTVTRPGVALMAASQAVELLVSLLQCKNKDTGAHDRSLLGDVPHQIRGFLGNFTTLKLETPAYDHCSACSSNIIETCKELKWEFVKNALNNPDYIENLSGLNEVKNVVENLIGQEEDWTFSGDDCEGNLIS